MTKVYLVSVDDPGLPPNDLGIFSSIDLAEEYIHKKYSQHKGNYAWEGKAWYIFGISVDDPESSWESILVNVHDRPINP